MICKLLKTLFFFTVEHSKCTNVKNKKLNSFFFIVGVGGGGVLILDLVPVTQDAKGALKDHKSKWFK